MDACSRTGKRMSREEPQTSKAEGATLAHLVVGVRLAVPSWFGRAIGMQRVRQAVPLPRRIHHGSESMVTDDCRSLCSGFPGLGLLGKPQVVSFYSLRGTQSAPVGVYKLVPDDDLPA